MLLVKGLILILARRLTIRNTMHSSEESRSVKPGVAINANHTAPGKYWRWVLNACIKKFIRFIHRIGLFFPPEGFINYFECYALYKLGSKIPGPFLEIGPWVGRSTACVAQGIKKSGREKEFHTVDIGFASEEDWEDFFGSSLKHKIPKVRKRYLKHILRKGGSIQSLKENLQDRGLDKYVIVHEGNFRDISFGKKFNLIFCDATHDLKEIESNIPLIKKLLSSRGVLVCDDIKTKEMESVLRNHFNFKSVTNNKGFFIGYLDDNLAVS